MRRIEIALVIVLLVPVVTTGAASLMSWPIRDKLFHLSIGWVIGWLACYLAARFVVWGIVQWVGDGPNAK